MIALLSSAWATSGFDPSTSEARFEGSETWTQIEDVRLWNAIERWSDPDRTLLTQEAFNPALAWKDTDFSPWIATAFGTGTPPSSTFLLHVGLHEETATGTPILMVPGAGDNGSRGFVTMATRMDRTNRPVFALTFAHPHGDVFAQAEVVADAIAVIRQRTGADEVDVVGHSKGGIAAAIYASNHPGASWGAPAYEQVGTPYRGDIRRMILVATPLGGVDTSFRWPGLNLYSLDPDTALSPSAWNRYYPTSTAVPLVFDSLVDQDFLPDGADLFPGQRQLLARQEAPLPGTQAWLGVYALQPDWYTTYEGGLGFSSRSDGIDAAIEAGGRFVERLHQVGVDPDVEVYLLAGTNPLMPNGDDALADQFQRIGNLVDYADTIEAVDAHGIPLQVDADEMSGLNAGWVVLGEISGISDGLVMLDSALDVSALDARGANVVVEQRNVSHLDLLYASPITGQLLIDAADQGGPDEQWMRGFGKRYVEADTLGWVETVLADPPGPETTGDTGAVPPTEGPAAEEDTEFARPCGACATGGPATAPWLAALLLLFGWRRKP